MKKLIFSIAIAFLTAQFATATNSDFETPKDFTKEIVKDFQIGEEGIVSIKNKYGYVNVKTSTGSTAEFRIQIVVKEGKESKAKDMLDKIDVDFKAGNGFVSAETEINTSSSWWNKWWKSNSSEFTINYDVTIPLSANLNINNKYGDVTVEELSNDLNINLKYGNLYTGSVSGDVDLNVAFGKVIAESYGDLDATVSYSDKFSIASAGNIDIESKYSKIYIDQAEDMDIESKSDEYWLGEVSTIDNTGKYDEFHINKVRSIDVETKHSNIEINTLERDGDIVMEFGTLKIPEVSPAFTDLELECTYTAISMDINTAFAFEIESKYTNIKLPSSAVITNKDDDGDYLQGFMGQQNNKAELTAQLKHGSLKIN